MNKAPFELDVRPLLASGTEPFQAIMEAVEALEPQQSLVLIAPFKPVPLFSVLERRGYQASPEPLGDGGWKVVFSPMEHAIPEIAVSNNASEAISWPEPSHYLDCSEMDPPQPMVAILTELEAMTPGSVLFVVIPREPLFLFPELESRGHQWVGNFDEAGAAYRMMIRVGDRQAA